MKPLNRAPQAKGKSAKHFSNHAGKTKYQNVRPNPMRGGIRL